MDYITIFCINHILCTLSGVYHRWSRCDQMPRAKGTATTKATNTIKLTNTRITNTTVTKGDVDTSLGHFRPCSGWTCDAPKVGYISTYYVEPWYKIFAVDDIIRSVGDPGVQSCWNEVLLQSFSLWVIRSKLSATFTLYFVQTI